METYSKHNDRIAVYQVILKNKINFILAKATLIKLGQLEN